MQPGDLVRIASILVFGLPPLAGIVAWLIGLVLHGLGRSTAVLLWFVLWTIGAVIGSSLEIGLAVATRRPSLDAVVDALVALVIPVVIVGALAMSGRRRAAGILLAGAATPWTVISATYLLEIGFGADWEPLVTVAMVAIGIVPLVAGALLAAWGDPVREPDPSAPAGQPGSRRPGSLGLRLMREATYGPVGPSIVATLAAASITGLALPGQPLVQLAIALVAALLGTEVELSWIPPWVRPAIEGYHWVGRAETARFRAATGSAVPRTPGGLRRWLSRHPETDVTRFWRVDMLAVVGQHAEARAELDRFVPSTPQERLDHAALAAELDWIAGGPADLASLRALAADVAPPESPERLRADGSIAWWASKTALAAMDPAWHGPLATFRARLGPAANGLHATAMRSRTLLPPLVVGIGFVALGQLAL